MQLLDKEEFFVDNKFAIFGKDFEATLEAILGEEYCTLQEKANQYSLSKEKSKPLIARYVAEKIIYQEDDERWLPLKLLVEKIKCFRHALLAD